MNTVSYEKFDEKEALKRFILSDLHTFVKHLKDNYDRQRYYQNQTQ